MNSQQEKYLAFKALHEGDGAFVIPNPWDMGSARMLAGMGFQALATSSAGYGFSVGKRDSFAGMSRAEILANARDIAQAVDVPVSADLEDGFGAAPEICADTIKLACGAGLVGGSIEDASGDPDKPIYDFSLALERVQASAEAAKDLPFLLTARAENYLCGNPDLDDTIRRLKAFADAGADVLFAPGLPDIDAIRLVCDALDKPVNVVMGLKGPTYSVEELSQAGVRRISVGGSFARAAYGAMIRVAQQILDQGNFDYAADIMPGAEVSRYSSQQKLTDRLGPPII